MNYDQLKVRSAELAAQRGWLEKVPGYDWSSAVNKALYEFSWRAEYNRADATFSTVIDQAEYSLSTPPDWIRVTDCIYSTTPLVLTDENTIRRYSRTWLTDASSTPTAFWLSEPNKVRLYPKPSAVATVTVHGITADTALSASSDTPSCPQVYHEGIALLAAYHFAKSFAKSEDRDRVQAFHAEAMNYADDLKNYLANQAAPSFQRRVAREAPERLGLGWIYRST